MSAPSSFLPGTLITNGRLGAATIYAGTVTPSVTQRLSRAIGVMQPQSIGIVLQVLDGQQLLIVVGTMVGVVMIAEITPL